MMQTVSMVMNILFIPVLFYAIFLIFGYYRALWQAFAHVQPGKKFSYLLRHAMMNYRGAEKLLLPDGAEPHRRAVKRAVRAVKVILFLVLVMFTLVAVMLGGEALNLWSLGEPV